MSKIEILAPVGSEEMLRAAVFSGADAVYLGFSGFNARTGAGNFDADSLKEAVRFCHARGVAVHVALNTTVYGGELAALCDAIRAEIMEVFSQLDDEVDFMILFRRYILLEDWPDIAINIRSSRSQMFQRHSAAIKRLDIKSPD